MKSLHTHNIALVAGLLFLLAAPSQGMAQMPWDLTRDESGIRSYKRVRADSPLLAFRAQGLIDAPLPNVMKVLLDSDRAGEWIPFIVESKVLRQVDGPAEFVQFTRFDVPWPVKDRYFVSRVTVDIDPKTFETEIRYFNIDSELRSQGALRAEAGGSYYLLRPVDGGARTYFMGVSVADPNGVIPKWLINWVGASVPHDTIIRLREHVARNDREPVAFIDSSYADLGSRPTWSADSAEMGLPDSLGTRAEMHARPSDIPTVGAR